MSRHQRLFVVGLRHLHDAIHLPIVLYILPEATKPVVTSHQSSKFLPVFHGLDFSVFILLNPFWCSFISHSMQTLSNSSILFRNVNTYSSFLASMFLIWSWLFRRICFPFHSVFPCQLLSSSSSSVVAVVVVVVPLYAWYLHIFLKQTIPLGHAVSLFMVHITLFPVFNLLHFYISTFRSVQCPMWLFSVVPWLYAFPICYSGNFWMILRWFQLPPFLLV